jgi:VCBS repeat-containing protein
MGRSSLSVWLNDGSGHFTQNPASVASLNLANRDNVAIALGDVDGNGSLDLVLRGSLREKIVILLNDGHGVFSDVGREFGVSGNLLALGDLNGDGALDIFAPSQQGGSYVWLNNGDGTFTDTGAKYEDNLFPLAVQLADVNGDGALDGVVVQEFLSLSGGPITNRSTVYLNNGHGQFTNSGQILGSYPAGSSGSVNIPPGLFGVGDLDNSGSPDLFLPIGTHQPSQVWLNQSALGLLQTSANFVVNDSSTVAPFGGVSVVAPSQATVTLTVSLDDISKGSFTAASLAASGFTGPTGNTYSHGGTAATSVQAALRQLVFAPTPNHVPVGSSEVTTFTIVASNGTSSRTNSATTVTSLSVDDPPAAIADGGTGFTTTDSASFVTGNVLANDIDPDKGDSITLQGIDTSATAGLVTNLGNGTFRYDPNGRFTSLPAGATATDSFQYTIRDNSGETSSGTVTITINGVNQAPVAADDAITVNEGSGATPITPLVLANDTDPDLGDQAALSITGVNTNGTLGLVQLVAGDLRYNPIGLPNLAPGVQGTDSFRYTISDGHGGTASATVHVTVAGVNDPPVVGTTLLSLSSDVGFTNLTSLIVANASDPDPGETAGLQLVSLDTTLTRGLALLSTNSLVFYQPTNFAYLTSGETATDTFACVMQDVHGARGTGTVEVTVIGVNDAPIAAPDYVVFNARDPGRDLTALLKANDSDPDGPASALVITAVTPGPAPLGALQLVNGTVTYQPNPSLALTNQQVVTDTFTYTLSDAFGATNSALVTVYIVGNNTPPVANPATFTVNENQVLNGNVTASDSDGDPLTYAVGASPTNGVLTLTQAGQFTYTPNTNFSGADSFTFKANDGQIDSPFATVNVTVIHVDQPPTVSVAPPTINVQYSDPIPLVTVTATDVDSSGSNLTTTVSWSTNGAALVSGLPSGLTLAPTKTNTNSRTWTLSGVPQLAPGSYSIRVAGTDDQGASNSVNVPLLVTPEDARITYTGAKLVSTASASSSNATILLTATIQDITAVTNDPAYDPNAGDIRNATITFVNRDNNTILATNLPVALVTSSNLTTGTATYPWGTNTGVVSSKSFTVGTIVNGYYARNATNDNVIITLSKPAANRSATGAGFLTLSRSAGQKAGDVGSHMIFAFDVRFTGTTKVLQGAFTATIQSGKRFYQVVSSSINTLAISGQAAAFDGKAAILDVTNPLSPLSIDKNALFQVELTDNGTSGATDTLALTVWSSVGGLWFASSWDGTQTVEQTLGSGNVVIGSATPSNLNSSGGAAELMDARPLELSIVWLPNTKARAEVEANSPTGYPQVSFATRSGATYTLEVSSDLITWNRLDTVAGNNQTAVYLDATGNPDAPRFYRVRETVTNTPE